jgi:hypothetical protein
MSIEDRIRETITSRVSRIEGDDAAWESMIRRIEGSGGASPARRASTIIVALAIASAATVAVFMAFRGTADRGAPAGEPSVPTSTPSSEPQQTICFESRSQGDFDGDGLPDTAMLAAVVPGTVECDGAVAEMEWRFELTVDRGSGDRTVQPFDDCQSVDCHLEKASDFDADGRSEIVVTVGPGASVSFARTYRVEGEQVTVLPLDPPGDPEGSLQPGPLVLGGPHDAIAESGFYCHVDDDGSRALIAWQARRDDGESPWNVHLTTLELLGNNFAVLATEEDRDVVDLPGRESCP